MSVPLIIIEYMISSSASVLDKPVSFIGGVPCDADDPVLMPAEHLEARICELAGHMAAASCRYLLLVADFDARQGWAAWDMPSCAAWLAWKCQVAPGTAREQVRVARALAGLPVIRAEFAAGRFSYSKVRALTRIATPDTEAGLAEMAECMTAGQLERFAEAHRKVSRSQDEARQRRRRLTWRVNEDGTITISATLPPEDGAVVLKALRASADDRDHPHHAENLADALVEVCASSLQAKIATADNPDVYQVIIHAGAAAITQDDTEPPGDVSAETPQPRWPVTHPAHADRCHIEDGPALSPAALQYIGCNATISAMVHDADGNILAVGRRTRKAPPALRRAILERDQHRCRFPGCESRKVDLHHIRHWSRGGETSLHNMTSLCRRHHRIIHDKGHIITPAGELYTANGQPIPRSPSLPQPDGDITTSHHSTITYHTIIPPHSGERLDLHEAIRVTFHNAEVNALRRQEQAA